MTDVGLEDLRDCIRMGISLSLATCPAGGVPNISYINRAHYLDSERIATSRQVFNVRLADLDSNPHAQAMIVDPRTLHEYRLDLQYLHTLSDGDAYDTVRATLDGIASETGQAPAFRLRGLDVHRVLRCARIPRTPWAMEQAAGPDLLEPLEQFGRRLERATSYDEAARDLLEALDDLFGFPNATLFAMQADALVAVAGTGRGRESVGTAVAVGTGLVGTAAARRRQVVGANMMRSRAMGDGDPADHRSAAAVPLIVGRDVLGVLYLESQGPTTFGGRMEGLLRIIGMQAAASLAARGGPAPTVPRGPAGPRLDLSYYQADDTVLCGSTYIVKGAPGRILWSMLVAHASTGRTQFSNRELRLDERLGLPAGNENLEARLLVLRRRLAELDCGVALERVARGQLELRLDHPAALTEVPTDGPMRAAHQVRDEG